MIIPNREEKMLEIHYCPPCNQLYYTRGEAHISCLVNHSPGSCCHMGEVSVSKDDFKKVMEFLVHKKSLEDTKQT